MRLRKAKASERSFEGARLQGDYPHQPGERRRTNDPNACQPARPNAQEMPMNATPATLRLARHEVRRFDRAVLLRAETGTLWLTVDGEPEDIVLEAGQARAFDGRAPVLATPLGGDALLSVVPATPAGLRWALRWRGAARGGTRGALA
jgi:hypothetical protein